MGAAAIRSDPHTVRMEVRARDNAVCAQCGTQCDGKRYANNAEHIDWEADHIVPISEGGGCCGLDNYQTLCVPCHKKESAALAGRQKGRKQSKGVDCG
ncbi:unnamed protein product [marine sediment metagenome]|uniref:HNH nuclease domain-containing protein n=1 Tax=marine sediment metagenome TaxID=412755 RepID=X0V5Z8_9ZZZZ